MLRLTPEVFLLFSLKRLFLRLRCTFVILSMAFVKNIYLRCLAILKIILIGQEVELLQNERGELTADSSLSGVN